MWIAGLVASARREGKFSDRVEPIHIRSRIYNHIFIVYRVGYFSSGGCGVILFRFFTICIICRIIYSGVWGFSNLVEDISDGLVAIGRKTICRGHVFSIISWFVIEIGQKLVFPFNYYLIILRWFLSFIRLLFFSLLLW